MSAGCFRLSKDQSLLNYIQDKAVVFWHAQWCLPSGSIHEAWEGLEREFGDKITFVRVDVDEHESSADEWNVQATPTFTFFVRRENVQEFSGANKEKLEGEVRDFVARSV
eukprot:Hpha_TRINITY_DN2716_c0_g1::TRINITY_DN2716_c0_g1_i1::g.110366::m.110366/K03671/trxA; thioredoxin 1